MDKQPIRPAAPSIRPAAPLHPAAAQEPEQVELPEAEPVAIEENEPIQIFDGPETEGSAVRAFGSGAKKFSLGTTKQFTRTPSVGCNGAIRCRVFHSRIAAAPLEYMENQINEWLDSEEIEVKQVGHMIGTMEGKSAEPNVILVIWY